MIFIQSLLILINSIQTNGDDKTLLCVENKLKVNKIIMNNNNEFINNNIMLTLLGFFVLSAAACKGPRQCVIVKASFIYRPPIFGCS